MGGFSNNHIDSYEKKISVYQLHRMCRNGRLVFPSVPLQAEAKRVESVSEMLETILMGITLPVIYVSERQDGSLLVLDTSNRLRYFMEFLEGYYPVAGLEFYPELNGYRLKELEQQFPRVISLIYDYKICFQIIDYSTPKYMHMQVGNYIGKWDFAREQGIRYELYGKELQDILGFLEKNLGQCAVFLSKGRLNRQYLILRILMYHFVFKEYFQVGYKEDMGLQELLDRTAECLRKKHLGEISDAFKDATLRLISWNNRRYPRLPVEKGKERQARMLGYLYNAVWMCRARGYNVEEGLERIFSDEHFWENIQREKVTFINIRNHYYEMEKRLG